VDEVQPRHLPEQLARQVLPGPDPAGGVAELAPGARRREEFLEVAGRQIGAGSEDEGHAHEAGDVPQRGRVVGQAAQVRPGGDPADAGHGEGVSVRRGARHRLHADHPAAAGPVLDHHGLVEVPRQRLGEQARGEVHAAAGRKGHDKADRPRRIPRRSRRALRPRGADA
jgi:hypothetical protein